MRPQGAVRVALLAALQAGAMGTVDAMAAQVGAPMHQVRRTLCHLSREGAASVHRVAGAASSRTPGRPRVVYGPPQEPPCDALAFVLGAWR